MTAMLVRTYFKRLRMEALVARTPAPAVPPGYALVPWAADLSDAHAEVKYRSFRRTPDSTLFPNLGRLDGCLQLMRVISSHAGFVPQATWLIRDADGFCGCIQGVETATRIGLIQNLGVLAEHRGNGLGAALLAASLRGFRDAGLRVAGLEVSARNTGAVRLYHRFGFQTTKTLYRETREEYTEYWV
ncbi:MAG TPA: GNAT family N-acetyltransferase [Gemmataceae bacterium]|jgi:ribosomal protein S18 acetylase RimI-like enzyme|nr:GNAT family N-acetyltransferase [Gemmataceae bacterium]